MEGSLPDHGDEGVELAQRLRQEDRVQLDRVEPEVEGRVDPGQSSVQRARRGSALRYRPGSRVSRLMLTRSRPAAASSAAKSGSSMPLVVSDTSVTPGIAFTQPDQVGQLLPDQRLAPGQPDLGDAHGSRRPCTKKAMSS